MKWSWWGCDRIAAGSAYLSALREGAARIGPDGQRTGLVNAEEEKFAAAQLAEEPALVLRDADREAHVNCNS